MATNADQAASALESALTPSASSDDADARSGLTRRQRVLKWHQKHAVWLWPVLATAAVCLYRATSITLWWDELTSYEIGSKMDVRQRTIGACCAVRSRVHELACEFTVPADCAAAQSGCGIDLSFAQDPFSQEGRHPCSEARG